MNKLKTLVAKLPFGKSGFSWKLNLCILAAILVIDGDLVHTQHQVRRNLTELNDVRKLIEQRIVETEQLTEEAKRQAARLTALRAKLLAENPCLVVPAHAIWSE